MSSNIDSDNIHIIKSSNNHIDDIESDNDSNHDSDNNIETDNININNTMKRLKIQSLKKLTMPILYSLQDKLEAIFYSLDESTQDCDILNDSNNVEFNDLLLELEIIFNDISKLEVGLDTCLIHTAGLLGSKYFNKLSEFQNETEQMNNKPHWKSGISKWMLPLFFYMMMLVDENSIINSPKFDKDYCKNLEFQKLKDELDSQDIEYTVENDIIHISNNNIGNDNNNDNNDNNNKNNNDNI
jgi:hypothetical protein